MTNLWVCYNCDYRFKASNRCPQCGSKDVQPVREPSVELRPSKKTASKPVESEQRICFGIKWFASEDEANTYHKQVRAAGKTFNGGWFHGKPCGRDTSFDKTVDGRKLYAVTD